MSRVGKIKFPEFQGFGVYALVFHGSNCIYIGSTIAEFLERRRRHFFHIQRGDHQNQRLVEMTRKYGMPEFKVLWRATVKDRKVVREKEQELMRYYGYSHTILNHYDENNLPSQEVRKKIASTKTGVKRGKYKRRNNHGSKHSSKTR